MMSQGIASGFSAWLDLWNAKVYALGKLREVGNRLRAPGKAVAFKQWMGLGCKHCAATQRASRRSERP